MDKVMMFFKLMIDFINLFSILLEKDTYSSTKWEADLQILRYVQLPQLVQAQVVVK
ncbi:MAG: hypothetical protein WKF68_10570 [Daejeonella sp.]